MLHKCSLQRSHQSISCMKSTVLALVTAVSALLHQRDLVLARMKAAARARLLMKLLLLLLSLFPQSTNSHAQTAVVGLGNVFLKGVFLWYFWQLTVNFTHQVD